MIDYIGDISKADAELLQYYAKQSSNILEFGCGASTQVLRCYSEGVFTSVETAPEWIQKTKENVMKFTSKEVIFKDYFYFVPGGEYDLIFNDGVEEFRLPFANTWKHLKIGGYLLFHDTRRINDMKKVCVFIENNFPEIESIYVNKDHSNITVLKKKEAEIYVNWNEEEGRTHNQIGNQSFEKRIISYFRRKIANFKHRQQNFNK